MCFDKMIEVLDSKHEFTCVKLYSGLTRTIFYKWDAVSVASELIT